jgi:cation diffusion facilitator CzcD-associated flavoprotein CzcO
MTITESLAVTARREIAGAWLAGFEAAVQAGDTRAAAGMFLADGYWRDILALTWDLRTFAGRDWITAGLAASWPARSPSGFWLEGTAPDMFERRTQGWTIEAFFTFETDVAHCRGHVRLLADPQTGEWKAWTLLTAMEDLKGFEEKAGALRPVSSAPHGVLPPGGNGVAPGAATAPGWGSGGQGTLPGDTLSAASPAVPPPPAPGGDPEVLVIGAGQAGLTIAARLRQLDVSAVVIEREARVGDNWRHRYSSLVLHNQVWANHLPYLKFPASWPAYLSKDELAGWLESYASIMSLDVWTSTEITGASYDEAAARWTVTLRRAGGTVTELHPRHVVLATGVFGAPHRLEIPGAEHFTGRLLHATEYTGGTPAAGVRALVVGSGSSAHDVAQDLYEAGAQVTMLQRSSTCVVSLEPGAARAYSIYCEDGAPTEDCDLVSNSFPLPLLAELHKDMTARIAQMDDSLLRGLRAAGFQLDFGDDGSGFLMKYHRTGGGYYINVGCSELIVAGKIKVKHGAEIAGLAGRTVRFTDGTAADTDMIVVATGYQNMSESVRALFGDGAADRVGPVWGLDAEGEVRAMWRRTGQPGLWIMGGSLQQCRPYSKYLALQIKGCREGLVPLAADRPAPGPPGAHPS